MRNENIRYTVRRLVRAFFQWRQRRTGEWIDQTVEIDLETVAEADISCHLSIDCEHRKSFDSWTANIGFRSAPIVPIRLYRTFVHVSDYRLCREHRISVRKSHSTSCIDILQIVVVALVSHFAMQHGGYPSRIPNVGALLLASLPRRAPRCFPYFFESIENTVISDLVVGLSSSVYIASNTTAALLYSTMTSMLRTRRVSARSIQSLPTFDDSSRGSSCCPSPTPVDEFSTSEFDEDDIYPVKMNFYDNDNSYYSPQAIIRSRQQQNKYKNHAIRAIAIIVITAVIAINGSSWRSRTNVSNSQGPSATFESTDIGSSYTDEALQHPESHRRLLETTTISSHSLSPVEQTQQKARQQINEKFGAGPHLVEFVLHIWEGDHPIEHYFTIEMAPTDIMPVAVWTFLEQVNAGLWDGTSFHINADHVLAARPVSGNGQISKRDLFERSGYGSLPVAEFSAAYPHLPYTLGFVGQGPAFYINKVHNEHDDACFGNVVIGRYTVDTIGKMRGYDHDPTRIRPVDIVSARIVSPQYLNEQAMAEYQANTRR